MGIHDFVKKRRHLFWSVGDLRQLDDRAIVEATLNRGDWDDVQQLFQILGIKNAAAIFRASLNKSRFGRRNYDPKTALYFSRYFKKHA